MGFKIGFVKETVYDLDWSSRCSMVIGSCSREQQQEALQKSRFIVHSWARSKFSSFCRSCLLWNPKTKRSKTKKQGCVVGCVVWWPSIIMDNDTAECPTIPCSRRLIFEYSYIARLKKTHHDAETSRDWRYSWNFQYLWFSVAVSQKCGQSTADSEGNMLLYCACTTQTYHKVIELNLFLGRWSLAIAERAE